MASLPSICNSSTVHVLRDMSCFHFVLLHHGYHGRAVDFHYLCTTAEALLKADPSAGQPPSSASPPQFVFVSPKGSDFVKTERGVLVCAERYLAHATAQLNETLSAWMAKRAAASSTSSAGSVSDCGAEGLELHFSAVGHSMGGLVLRSALPRFMAHVEATLAGIPGRHVVSWDTMCTMSTPHLGITRMRSPVLTWLGSNVGRYLSTAVGDLFCGTSLVKHDLVTDESLAAWARFKRRVLLNVVNDGTVLLHSSSFLMPVDVRQLFSAPLAVSSSPTAAGQRSADDLLGTAITPTASSEFSAAEAAAVRGPSHDRPDPHAQPPPFMGITNKDKSVMHLAEHGIYCASTVEGLQRNGYEVRGVTEALWPASILPDERALAERILRQVGPLELHLFDFRPLYDAPVEELHGPVVEARKSLDCMHNKTAQIGSHNFSHAAMVCKSPYYQPAFFGFPSEYVVKELLGISSHRQGSESAHRCSL